MRLFSLLNNQHIIGYVFPTLIFMILFWVGLAFMRFNTRHSESRASQIIYRFPTGIEDRNAPFPLVMTLIIAGTILWMLLYILFHGLLGVNI